MPIQPRKTIVKAKSVRPAAVARTPCKELSWQKAQSASNDAHVLFKMAPDPVVFKPCFSKLLEDAKLILNMSLGKHGVQRTAVPELRGAIARLQANSQELSPKGWAFVKRATDGMLDHLGCVNTDKSFKPFAVVLNTMFELARMSSAHASTARAPSTAPPAGKGLRTGSKAQAGQGRSKTARRASPAAAARTPLKELSWQKAQSASHDAYQLFRMAPDPSVFKPYLSKLLEDTKLIFNMTLGKHGEERTPVRDLRAAIARLQANSHDLSPEGRAFVMKVTDGMRDHLGCVNTDKSFKPFAVVLDAMLELAKMSAS